MRCMHDRRVWNWCQKLKNLAEQISASIAWISIKRTRYYQSIWIFRQFCKRSSKPKLCTHFFIRKCFIRKVVLGYAKTWGIQVLDQRLLILRNLTLSKRWSLVNLISYMYKKGKQNLLSMVFNYYSFLLVFWHLYGAMFPCP